MIGSASSLLRLMIWDSGVDGDSDDDLPELENE